MEISTDNRPGAVREKICQRLELVIMLLQAEQGEGCHMFTAGTSLPSHALAADTIPENKTALGPAFCHLNCCQDVFVRNQSSPASLERKKTYFFILQQCKSLFHGFFAEPGFQGNPVAGRQNRHYLQRSCWRR